jgi:putative RecB family exonuclease
MSQADERWEKYKTRPRSWSQLTQYEECPHRFRLERIEKVWSRPAAWFATGLGVHSAVEAYEKGETPTLDDMVSVAEDAFRADVNERLAETPNAEFWQSSGPYHGPEDIPRRYRDLRRHLSNFLMIRESLSRPIWRPDGETPAVEWSIDLDLDGVKVIGSADRITEVVADSGEVVDLVIEDVKAGSKTPDEPGQLATYAVAARQKTGLPVTKGAYLMTAKKPTPKGRVSAAQVVEKDLTTIPVETLTARFHRADEGIKAGNWDPKPGDQCGRCSVKDSCVFRSVEN